MNIRSRAANRLRRVDPEVVCRILDDLPNRWYGPGSHLVEVAAIGATCRCFVARHKDHARILLNVVELRGS